MSKLIDYMGNEIKIGQKGIMCQSYSHNKYFKRVEILDINTDRKWNDCIKILAEGNSKPGWTYASRIITEDSFKNNLL